MSLATLLPDIVLRLVYATLSWQGDFDPESERESESPLLSHPALVDAWLGFPAYTTISNLGSSRLDNDWSDTWEAAGKEKVSTALQGLGSRALLGLVGGHR